MRTRRGNYAVLFVLTVAIMLSYLAFSIDGGRMKVAVIQAEGAAEAAGLAALEVIRSGGTQGDAEEAAFNAANQIRLQRVENRSKTEEFDVEVEWGSWDWDEPMTEVGGRWTTNSTRSQSITVNVFQKGAGLVNIFGPFIQVLVDSGKARRSDLTKYGDDEQTEDYGRFKVQQGARAAMRQRNVVFVVDGSPWAQLPTGIGAVAPATGFQQGMAAMIDIMDEFDIPGDRVSIVNYAGTAYNYRLDEPSSYQSEATIPAEPGFPLYEVSSFYDDMRDTALLVEPCRHTVASWYRYGRFAEASGGTVYDPEQRFFDLASASPGVSYFWRAVTRWPQAQPPELASWQLDEVLGGEQAAIMGWLQEAEAFQPSPPGQPTWQDLYDNRGTALGNIPLLKMCQLWDTMLFNATGWSTGASEDARFERQNDASIPGASPLTCDDGNWYETRPLSERWGSAPSDAVWGNVCGAGLILASATNAFGGYDEPLVYYADPRDFIGPAYVDRAYSMAGANPGAGLQEAALTLASAGNNGENTVVWMMSHVPECGPGITQKDPGTGAPTVTGELCNDAYDAERAAALAALDALEVDLHIIGVPASEDPITFDETATMQVAVDSWTLGRGQAWYVEDPAQIPLIIDEIARDVRLQVVQ